MSDKQLRDGWAAKVSPGTPSKRDALDEYLWTYHDQRHTGSYPECSGCTELHMFFTDNPQFNIL